MNRIRIWMMTAALLAPAASANAQSVSVSSLQTASEEQELPGARNQQACDGCEASWYARAVQQGVSAWQRVRTMCASNCESGVCCQPACAQLGQVKPGVCRDVDGCVVGSAKGLHGQTAHNGTITVSGSFNSHSGLAGSIAIMRLVSGQAPCCGIKDFTQLKCPLGYTQLKCPLGYTAAQATAPCCCAKACACCETCKVKEAAGQVQALPPLPSMPMTWAVPQSTVGTAQAWVAPPAGARVVVATPVSASSSVAHLVTPDFEAHCKRITHHNGHVILEGNVMFLHKKNAQPMRIEAQRVVVNLRDGSFMVDANPALPAPPMPVGMMRTSGECAPPMALPLPHGTTLPNVHYRIEVAPTTSTLPR